MQLFLTHGNKTCNCNGTVLFCRYDVDSESPSLDKHVSWIMFVTKKFDIYICMAFAHCMFSKL